MAEGGHQPHIVPAGAPGGAPGRPLAFYAFRHENEAARENCLAALRTAVQRRKNASKPSLGEGGSGGRSFTEEL